LLDLAAGQHPDLDRALAQGEDDVLDVAVAGGQRAVIPGDHELVANLVDARITSGPVVDPQRPRIVFFVALDRDVADGRRHLAGQALQH